MLLGAATLRGRVPTVLIQNWDSNQNGAFPKKLGISLCGNAFKAKTLPDGQWDDLAGQHDFGLILGSQGVKFVTPFPSPIKSDTIQKTLGN